MGTKRSYQSKNKTTNTKTKLVIYSVALVAVVVIYLILNFMNVKPDNQKSAQPQGISSLDFRKDRELQILDPQGNIVVTIDIEIAEDASSRNQGLMHRESMGEHQGMLFIFHPVDRPFPISMWMKNTIIPLDMFFIRQNKTISQIAEHTVPFDLTGIQSDEPVSYVLEVNAGFAERYGIMPGYRVSW